MSGTSPRCAGLVSGTARAILRGPADAAPGPGLPCENLACEGCGAPVLHLDGVRFMSSPAAGLEALHASLDPLGWLALGAFDPAARAYACRCAWANAASEAAPPAPEGAAAPQWSCRGHGAPGPRPRLLSWSEVLRPALRAHLRAERWLVLAQEAYLGTADGGARRCSFDRVPADHVVDPGEAALLIDRLATFGARWVARQVAPPLWTTRPLYAAYLQDWKHGDVDGQSLKGTFADVPSLLTALRSIVPPRSPTSSIDQMAVPGLLLRDGYACVDEHP